LIEKVKKPLLLFPTKGDPAEYLEDGEWYATRMRVLSNLDLLLLKK
jgi:hypothetical protein